MIEEIEGVRKSVRGFQDKRAPETQLLRRQAQQQPLPPHQVQKLRAAPSTASTLARN